MRSLYSIFAALFLLPVLAALGATGSVCHDAHRSLVFDETGDLVVAANDVAVSRFAYDDGHCVVSAETGAGVAGGVAVAVHGADVASAGAYKLWYGVGQDTLTSQGLQAVGVPRDWANGVDAGVSVMGSAGVGMATKAVGGVAASSTEMIEVSRWGRAGLQDGDFVMKGDPSLSNYLLSGKFQPSWMPGNNIPATFKSGESFYVPKSSLSYPSGWEIIKAPLGQRIYSGPTIPPQP